MKSKFFLFGFLFFGRRLPFLKKNNNPSPPKKLEILQPEGETNPLKFSQAFVLAPLGGSWAVTNDVFRLNYA